MKRFILSVFMLATALSLGLSDTTFASKSNQIDDITFYNYNSMSEAQIASWISSNFPNSCLLPQNYPADYHNNGAWRNTTFKEPLSYFTYGGETSAARIIWKASQFYSLNPQVLIATLEKESDLVTGSKGCSAWRYNSAMGYNCWTGAENYLKDYPNLGIYQTCVQTESYAGFSPQVNKAAWQLSFDGKRANGDLSWMGDGNVTYYGRMTQGYRARVNGGAVNYYDGYTTINGEAVYLENGPTAALYNYTPFFTRFESIFTSWFGSTHAPNYSWQPLTQYAYTNDSKTTPIGLGNLSAGQRVYVGFTAKNTGNTTWLNSGANPVNLGTTRPYNRASQFADSTWPSSGRPARLKEPSVAPGQVGTFEFWITAPESYQGSFKEYFAPLAEGKEWMPDIGLYYSMYVQPAKYTWQLQSQYAFTDDTKTTGASLYGMEPGQRRYVGMTLVNTGNTTWLNTGNNPLTLGTTHGMNRSSKFADSTWLNAARPARMKEPSVAPGQTATFEFWIKAPDTTYGSFVEHFNPLLENKVWLNDIGLSYSGSVVTPNYSWQLVSQYAYSDQTKTTPIGLGALVPNQQFYLGLVAKNTSNVTWYNSGNNPINLGTAVPIDRVSQICGSGWLSCSRPARMKEPSVAPGQTATFEFIAKAPQNSGQYIEHLNLLSEGRAWMPTIGLSYSMRVQ